MAASKSKEFPYKWPDGTYHSISAAQHQANMEAAAAAAQNEQNAARAAEAAAIAAARAKAAPAPAPAPAPAASAPADAGQPAAASAPVDTGPAAPAKVEPFLTADDIDAINSFTTDLQTKLVGIDFGLQNQETDTTYQKSQTDKSAVAANASAQDDSIARGIFHSSIKDATLYDIEAQRSLSTKFLDDKLTAARLNAGTNKQILGSAKTAFDTNMLKHQEQNAQGVNTAASSAWAEAKAAWDANQPVAAPAAGPAPAAPSFAPAKGVASAPQPAISSAQNAFNAAQYAAKLKEKQATTAAQQKAKAPAKGKAKPVYG